MKALTLALTTAAAVALSAGAADAQYRYYGSYATPAYYSYNYPAYSYAAPSYYAGNGIVLTSGYTPAIAPTVYPGWNYYNPVAWAPAPVAYTAYSYPGVYYGPRGRGWRW